MRDTSNELSEKDERKMQRLKRFKNRDVYNLKRRKFDINPVERPHSPPKGKHQYDRDDGKDWRNHIEDEDDYDIPTIMDEIKEEEMTEEERLELQKKLDEFNRKQKLN